MLARWWRYMPVALVAHVARRRCERFSVGGIVVVSALDDCFIKIVDQPKAA